MALTTLTNKGAQKAVAPDELISGHLYKGRNGKYLDNGDTIRTGVTHVRLSQGVLAEMFPKASGIVSSLTGTSAVVGTTAVSLIPLGLAELRKNGDVRGWFADPTGTISSVDQIALASEDTKGTSTRLKASGVFLIDKPLYLKGADCDFSNAKFIIQSTGSIIFDDERELSEKEISFTSTSIDQSQLFEGQVSFSNLFNDSSVLEDWADSFVIIETDDVYVTRIDGTNQSPQNKKVVTYLNKYGRLTYSINFDLTTSSNVTVRLIKRPEKMHNLELPSLSMQSSSSFSIVLIRRSLVEVNRPVFDLSNFTATGIAERLLGIDETFGCTINNIGTTGYGVPDGVTDPSETKYDINLRSVLDLTINNPNCGTSWKSIDGNNCRNIKVYGGVIDSFHGHFNCSDILVDKTTITGDALAFGIGSKDSNIVLRDCQYNLRKGYLFSVRRDYGSLRGKVKIEGGVWNTDYSSASTVRLIDLTDSAIYQSGVVQPNTYELPSNIEVTGLKIIGSDPSKVLNLLYMPPNRVYTANEKLKPPKDIIYKDLDVGEFAGDVDFYYTMTSFDEGDVGFKPCNITLSNIKGKTVILDLGNSSSPTTVAYYATIEDTTVTTRGSLRAIYGKTGVSTIHTKRCVIDGHIDTRFFEGFKVSHYNGTYRFIDASDITSMVFGPAVVTESIGMTYDARDYVSSVGSEPVFPGVYVHNSVDNVAIQCDLSPLSKPYTPHKGTYTGTLGQQTLINEVGEPKNWGWDGSKLVKRW